MRASAETTPRLEGDRGAVLVEFALVMPILVMLLFGLVSAGMAWNQNLSLSSAARAGARYGATLPTSTTGTTMDDYLAAITQRVIDSSEGNLGSSVTSRVICVAYWHPSGTATLDQNRARTLTNTTVTTSSTTPCFTDGQGSDDKRIQITVQRTGTIQTGLWTQTVTLSQKVVFRYEVTSGL